MQRKIKIIFSILFLLEILFSYNISYAQTTPVYSGPQAGITQYLCTPTGAGATDLYGCINKLYRFAIVVCAVVGMFFIVIAGYVYMNAGGNQESVDKAKNMFTSTITAIVILFAGYILLRAINPDLIEFNSIQPPNAPAVALNTPPPTSGGGGGGTNPQGGQCSDSPPLCSAQSACPANACSTYSAAIQAVAAQVPIGNLNTAKLLSAIMYHESRCQIGATSPAGACGLMQFLPGTANTFKTQCGVDSSVTITCPWLENSANAQASICMSAKYLQSLANGVCGAEGISSIAAGYDGGSGACAPSTDCTSQTSCTGQPMEQWECTFNDVAHTVCNTGYTETRKYIPDLAGCYNNQ